MKCAHFPCGIKQYIWMININEQCIQVHTFLMGAKHQRTQWTSQLSSCES